jgi:hypothetical protein
MTNAERDQIIEESAKICDAKAANENSIFEQANHDAALSDSGRTSIQDRALGRNTLAKTIAREIRRLKSAPAPPEGQGK